MQINSKPLLVILKTWLLKALAVLWFTPIYTGALVCLGQAIIWLHHKAGFWFLGQAFIGTLMYGGALFYLGVLTYLAVTKRTWVPYGFVRFSVQYLFRLPKKLKKVPVLLFSGFSGFVYFFLNVMPVVEPFQEHLPTDTPGLKVLLTMAIAMAISLGLAMVVTHYLLKHVHFVKLHCMHELGK